MISIDLWSTAVTVITFFVCFFAFYKRQYGYWRRKNVPYNTPTIPFGSMENPLNRTMSLGQNLKKHYDQMKAQGHEYVGLYNFTQAAYMPIGLDYVKDVMQTKFQHFSDRGGFYNERDDPLSASLFAIGGQKWRNLRTKLTPTFTSGKMKSMFNTLVKCGDPMELYVTELSDRNEPVDIKETVARFTTDIIGSCAYGIECNSFESPDAEFRRCGQLVLEFPKIRLLGLLIFMSYPNLGRFFRMRVFNKTGTDFFMKMVKDTIRFRETNNVSRADMLNILIELKNRKTEGSQNKNDGSTITVEEIAAQAFVFFIAGFDTSSTTLTYCLFELARNPHIQQKVREEIEETLAKHDGKLTYESLSDLKYMGQAIDEALRMYPSLALLDRKCVKDYQLPGTNTFIEKDTTVFIPTYALHYDPQYFPEPEKFDPERFSDVNKPQIPQFAYIPFGEGPRACIGMRFGYMQVKVGLTVLLKNFEFFINSQTKLPLEIDPNTALFGTKGKIWLDAKKINDKKTL